MQHQTNLSGTALKRIACFAMLLDHIGAACLEVEMGIPYLSILQLHYLSAFAPEQRQLIVLDTLLRSMGRIAFPIFAFFLVEGFLHTKNATRYLLRLALFGLISEPIFDFAFFGQIYYPAYQNIYLTLCLGLLGMMLCQNATTQLRCKHTHHGLLLLHTMLYFGGTLGLLWLAEHLHSDYGANGVALILMLYLLRKQKLLQHTAVVLMTLEQFPAPFAVLPLACYNNNRGRCAKWEQLAFYAFYPTHLLVLGCINHLLH